MDGDPFATSSRCGTWRAYRAIRVADRAAWTASGALAIVLASGGGIETTDWRIAAGAVWAVTGVVMVCDAVVVRRLKRAGEWSAYAKRPRRRLTPLPPARPDEAYLVTFRRWRRARGAG